MTGSNPNIDPNTVALFTEIRFYMARAFFAHAFADQAEDAGQPLQGEILDQLPQGWGEDWAPFHAADTLIAQMVTGVKAGYRSEKVQKATPVEIIGALFKACKSRHGGRAYDREATAENFGHYLAMGAMGTGVGMECFGPDVAKYFEGLPYVEFGSHSLSKDYF